MNRRPPRRDAVRGAGGLLAGTGFTTRVTAEAKPPDQRRLVSHILGSIRANNAHTVTTRFTTPDDCVVSQSGRDADGRRIGIPTSYVVIEDMAHTGRAPDVLP